VGKLLAVVKESLLDKKWVLSGLGVLIGLLAYYLFYLLETMDFEALQAYFDSLPESMKALFGDLNISNPYSMMNYYLFAFLWLYCGIYLIYMASSLVSQEIEDRSIDLVLSKPVSRGTYLMGKIIFLFVFIIGLMGLITVFFGLGMGSSGVFLEEGLYWDRVWAVFLVATLHLGTLGMTAVFASTIFLSTKRTMAVAVAVMFLMFFIGGSYSLLGPGIDIPIDQVSTWFYYNTSQYFGSGNYKNFLRDVLVLGGYNIGLILASLIVFRERDIPV
jgi:ABC-2 type transport system permease protein